LVANNKTCQSMTRICFNGIANVHSPFRLDGHSGTVTGYESDREGQDINAATSRTSVSDFFNYCFPLFKPLLYLRKGFGKVRYRDYDKFQ
jgi:hypothetical protein